MRNLVRTAAAATGATALAGVLVASAASATRTLTPQPGSGSRHITLFRLDLSHARIRPGQNDTRVTGIGLDFSSAAAAALDHVLATTIFRAGLEFGTAAITLDNVAGLPASSRS